MRPCKVTTCKNMKNTDFRSEMQDPNPESEGGWIVRRFTDELDGNSTLERSMKTAQAENDAKTQALERQRVVKILESADSSTSPFDGAEIARRILEKECKEFFSSLEKPERHGVFWKRRRDLNSQLVSQLKQKGTCDFMDVRNLVNNLEGDWKKNHQTVHRNFETMCKSLHNHRNFFKLLPTNSDYVATLAGGLTLIVEASVNHSEIAEELTTSVAYLCERASICSARFAVTTSNYMQSRLSVVYQQLFSFLGEAAKWFMRSRVARLLDSFNKEMVPKCKLAAAKIDQSINLLEQAAQVVDSARIANMEASMESLVDSTRKQNEFTPPVEAGNQMIHLLVVSFQSREDLVSRLQTLPEYLQIENAASRASTPKITENMTREDADSALTRLDALISGEDGLALTERNSLFLADQIVINHLSSWMQNVNNSEKLWIKFPWELGESTGSRMASLGVISIAAQAQVPFISYICGKPFSYDIDPSQSPEQAGLLSMVFSLIRQLLKFRPPNDEFQCPLSRIDELNEKMSSWKPALELLADLLKHTTVLRYCVIEGFNSLESEDTEEQCLELLRLLFDCTKDITHPRSFLFTTSGDSEILRQALEMEEWIQTEEPIHIVEQRGQTMDWDISTE